MFSKEELERYSRHFVLQGFGEEAQKKLKHASVLVVGAGGLGAPLLQYLAAAGIGKIGIADFDHITLSNLQRQILFTTESIGKLKSNTSVEALKKLNPHIEFEIYSNKLTSKNALAIVQQYDVIADGTDNFPTRYLINDACVIAKKPLVYGSVHGYEGQCSVFNYNHGPNYRDMHPTPPDPNSVPNCSEGGVLGALAGIIGSIMAVESIKMAAGLEPGLSGILYLFDSLHYYNQKIKLGVANPINKVTELIDYDAFCSYSPANKTMLKSVKVDQLKQWLNDANEEVSLVDVREVYERSIGHIGGIHIPLLAILEKSNDVPLSGKVIFYCSGGVRSMHAIQQLQNHPNHSNFYNLDNGLHDWG